MNIKIQLAIQMCELLKSFNVSWNDALTFLTHDSNVDIFDLTVEQDFNTEQTVIIFNDDSRVIFNSIEYKVAIKTGVLNASTTR